MYPNVGVSIGRGRVQMGHPATNRCAKNVTHFRPYLQAGWSGGRLAGGWMRV